MTAPHTASLLPAIAFLLVGCAARSGGAPVRAQSETVTVRYQVADIARAIAFYTSALGFQLGERTGSAFAAVNRGNLRLVLSGPGASGSRPMPDGRAQTPGGWNRIIVYVDDLAATIAQLEKAHVVFRNTIEAGPGGKQIMIEDPDTNPIELHEAPAK